MVTIVVHILMLIVLFLKLTNADGTYIHSFFKLRNAYCTCISCEAKKMHIIHVFIQVCSVHDYTYLCFE